MVHRYVCSRIVYLQLQVVLPRLGHVRFLFLLADGRIGPTNLLALSANQSNHRAARLWLQCLNADVLCLLSEQCVV